MNRHIVPEYTEGIKCDICGLPASHKVEEVIEDDGVHPFTAYMCCYHFGNVMGKVAWKVCCGDEEE